MNKYYGILNIEVSNQSDLQIDDYWYKASEVDASDKARIDSIEDRDKELVIAYNRISTLIASLKQYDSMRGSLFDKDTLSQQIADRDVRIKKLEDYIRRGYQESKTKQGEFDYQDEGIALLKGESR